MKEYIEKLRDVLYRFRDLYCQNIDLSTIDEFLEEYPINAPSPSMGEKQSMSESYDEMIERVIVLSKALTSAISGIYILKTMCEKEGLTGGAEAANAIIKKANSVLPKEEFDVKRVLRQEPYAEYSGECETKPVWVKASERLPEPFNDVHFRVVEIEGFAPHVGFYNSKWKEFWSGIRKKYLEYDLSKIEWLDESVAPEPVEEKKGFTNMHTDCCNAVLIWDSGIDEIVCSSCYAEKPTIHKQP